LIPAQRPNKAAEMDRAAGVAKIIPGSRGFISGANARYYDWLDRAIGSIFMATMTTLSRRPAGACRAVRLGLGLGLSAGLGLHFLAAPDASHAADLAPAKSAAPLELARQLNQAFIDVASTVSPAVVVVSVANRPDSLLEIEVEEGSQFFEMLPPEFRKKLEDQREKRRKQKHPPADRGEDPEAESREPVFNGQGSGIAIRKEGYIVTNRHVVEDAERIKVRFQDGLEYDAVVRGSDAQSDLAVLKIDPGSRDIPVARLGDSSKVRVGEFAIAIGAPLELDYSVTFGHISAKGRSRIIDDPAMDQDFLQTDANINPGNSGGPLVNIDGEVIGINTLIRGLRTGIGFAIPANLIREVTDQLIAEGHFARAYLGIRIRAWRESSDYRDAIPGVKDGVVVYAIPQEGPASRSDLKPGDVITAVDGRPVTSPQELKNEIRGKKVGQGVDLAVHRFGKSLKVTLHPQAWPSPPEPPLLTRHEPSSTPPKPPSLGLTVQAISRELAEKFQIDRASGVLVTDVEKGSLAERNGLQPGDVIREINQKPITSVKQFTEVIKKTDVHQGLLVQFTSRGTSRFEILRAHR
jgi:serine protease Do